MYYRFNTVYQPFPLMFPILTQSYSHSIDSQYSYHSHMFLWSCSLIPMWCTPPNWLRGCIESHCNWDMQGPPIATSRLHCQPTPSMPSPTLRYTSSSNNTSLIHPLFSSHFVLALSSNIPISTSHNTPQPNRLILRPSSSPTQIPTPSSPMPPPILTFSATTAPSTTVSVFKFPLKPLTLTPVQSLFEEMEKRRQMERMGRRVEGCVGRGSLERMGRILGRTCVAKEEREGEAQKDARRRSKNTSPSPSA